MGLRQAGEHRRDIQVINNVFIGSGITGDDGVSYVVNHNYFGTATYGTFSTPDGTYVVNGGNPRWVSDNTAPGAWDFHIALNTSVLVGAGANLSAYFTTDKDGNTRPPTGAWDIGPYQYSTALNTTPVIQALPATLTFGSVAAGSSATSTFTVKNVGGGSFGGGGGMTTRLNNYFKELSRVYL